MNALEDILDHGEIWDEATLSETDYLLSKLNDFTFMFFINCFYVILSQAEKIFDILQCRKLDVKYAQDKIHDFIQSISNNCDNEHYEIMIQQTMTDMEISNESHAPPTKRTRGNRINYKSEYFEIIQNIISSLKERFANIGDFSYFELLDVKKFEVFSCTFRFPVSLFNGISTLFRLFNAKVNLLEEQYYLTHSWQDKCICPKVNIIARLENELAYYDFAVHRFNHYTTRTPPVHSLSNI